MQTGYFDRFWDCPGCHRAMSIAEIIELHCENCDAAVEPAEMDDAEPVTPAPNPEEMP
ncbi:hypothetical protein [Rhizobium lusitanum]|uniref:hypothetical protein n=1 Tax=Rhizobium lusitanum TaxID=293958 RepID=UPI001431CE2E|nr:hypothetical protein [Rhizobium lusitanum]